MQSSRREMTDLPQTVGTSRQVLMLLMDPYERDARVEKEAKTLVQFGHRVTVLAWNRFGTSKSEEVRDGARIERVTVLGPSGSRWRLLWRYPRVYWWFLRRGLRTPYDVLICHDIQTWPVGWVLKVLKRRFTVFDAHEPYAEQIGGILPSTRRFVPWLRRFEGYLARRASLVITVTPLMLERSRNLGLRRVFYLPNVPATPPCGDALRRPADGCFVLGRIGSMTPNYSGVEPLIEVARLLRSRGIPVHLVLGGPIMAGWESRLRAIIGECDGFVEYIGVVPVSDVLQWVARFDVMASLRDASPMKARYGWSSKIFDAMAVGTPVVTTPVGEDGDLVRETQCGEVLPATFGIDELAERLTALWRQPELRRRYGENGRLAYRERYNWAAYESAFAKAVTGMES